MLDVHDLELIDCMVARRAALVAESDPPRPPKADSRVGDIPLPLHAKTKGPLPGDKDYRELTTITEMAQLAKLLTCYTPTGSPVKDLFLRFLYHLTERWPLWVFLSVVALCVIWWLI